MVMGIRQKVMLGFVLLALLLCFSGMMSYFELNKLSSSTQSMLDASLRNMELSKEMLDAVQDQNTALLQLIVTNIPGADSVLIQSRRDFDEAISKAHVSIRDLPALDSIYVANMRYNELINLQFANTESTKEEQLAWVVDTYKSAYYQLTAAIKEFMISSQSMMDIKARQLESNAYRAIMPGIIALAIAVLIIGLFFYLIDIYYISPVLKITSALHNYLNARVPFKIEFEGKDELHSLKEYIETLIARLRSKKSE